MPDGCTARATDIKCADGALFWQEWRANAYSAAAYLDPYAGMWAKGGLTWTAPVDRSCVVGSAPSPCWAIDFGAPGRSPMRMFGGLTGTTAWHCIVRAGGDALPPVCAQAIQLR